MFPKDAHGVHDNVHARQAATPVGGRVVGGEVDGDAFVAGPAPGQGIPVTQGQDEGVAARGERIGERAADEPGGAGEQDAQRSAAPPSLRAFATRVLATGTVASVASSLAATLLGHHRTRSYASASNATSHWVWGDEAGDRHRADVPHTLVGYCIHHASSVFWATAYEGWLASRRPPHPVAAAAAVTLVAYMVDYHVVPRRLTPGFERHLHKGDMLLTYVAFGAGLAAAALWRQHQDGPPPPGHSE